MQYDKGIRVFVDLPSGQVTGLIVGYDSLLRQYEIEVELFVKGDIGTIWAYEWQIREIR